MLLSGTPAAVAASRGVEVSISLTHTAVAGRRGGGGDAAVSLPAWLDPVYEAQEMRDVDTWAIEEQGIPGEDLMERAGTGLARAVARVAAGSPGPIRIVAGKGNNGGDGHVAARLLREEGREVDVFDPGEEVLEGVRRGGGLHPRHRVLGRAARAGGGRDRRDQRAGRPGGGVRRSLRRGRHAPARWPRRRSGRRSRSRSTARRSGCTWRPARFYAGEVEVVEIGVPRGAPAPAAAGLISERVLELYPHRTREGSKFTSGVVVIAGGARGLTGRADDGRAGGAAGGRGLRAGGGARPAQASWSCALLEAMTHGTCRSAGGAHTAEGVEPLLEMAERAGAVVLGPGLGRSRGRGRLRARRGGRARTCRC